MGHICVSKSFLHSAANDVSKVKCHRTPLFSALYLPSCETYTVTVLLNSSNALGDQNVTNITLTSQQPPPTPTAPPNSNKATWLISNGGQYTGK